MGFAANVVLRCPLDAQHVAMQIHRMRGSVLNAAQA